MARLRSLVASRPVRPGAEGAGEGRAAVAALMCPVVAALLWVFPGRSFLNFDSAWALVWGREISRGILPSYQAALAPTPHPLATGFSALVSPLGEDAAATAVLVLTFLALSIALWAVFRLGQSAFSWQAGALAVLPLVTSFTVLGSTSLGYFDVWVAALVLTAALLEQRSRWCGTPVLALLTVAGLHRPEIWLLAGVYWLYLLPALDGTGRVRAAAWVAAAPLIWVLSDFAATGDALLSFGQTEANSASRDVGSAVESSGNTVFEELRTSLRLPALAGAGLGLPLALIVARSRSRVPVALAVLSVATAAVLAFRGVPIAGRYLLVASAGLSVFFGFFVTGWLRREPARLWPAWMVGALVILAGLVASAPPHLSRLGRLSDDNKALAAVAADLRTLVQRGEARATLDRCSVVLVQSDRPVPYLALYLDRPSETFRPDPPAGQRRVAVLLARSAAAREFLRGPVFGEDVFRIYRRVPTDFRAFAASRSWRLYSRGC